MKKVLVSCFIVCVAACAFAGSEPSKALAEVVTAERTFAETCAHIGIRDSFLKFFSEDVITFGPELRRGVSHLQQRQPDSPKSITLWWEPVYGDASAAGDMGYDTGPSVYTDKDGKKYYGMFFSVWQRQASGEWKVVVDAGLDTPKPEKEGHQDFQPAARQLDRGVTAHTYDAQSARSSLTELEQSVAAQAESEGIGKALLAHADLNLRLHRNGLFPIMGATATQSYLVQHDAPYRLEPLQAVVATSGDLAYAVGRYKKKASPDEEQEQGYYIRIWQRDAHGQWAIGLDSLLPLKR